MAASARSAHGGVERLGVSRSRDQRFGPVVVSLARSRDAWCRSPGTHGADTIGAFELFVGGGRHCRDEELVRNRHALAQSLHQDVAAFDGAARNSADAVSSVEIRAPANQVYRKEELDDISID